jgi:zinc protease
MVVLVRENFDAQSVVVIGSFAAGAIFEDPAKPGLASLTADSLMRGTKNYDFFTLHDILESSGMSLDMDGGRHFTSFNGKALAEDLPTLLRLLADVLRYPSFPAEHVELVKGEIITGLTYSQQDTRYMANKTFQELAYPEGHIYHRESAGTIESVSASTAEDLHQFHAQQYGPGKMILVIVGAVKTEDALAEVETALGDWQNPSQLTEFVYPDIPALDGIKSRVIELPGKTQSDLVLGVVGPSRTSPDYLAARLANNVLGVFGMMGRLGASVREQKGLAYYSYSSIEGGTGRGAWNAIAGVNPRNVKLAVDSIREEISRMIETPVSQQDLADNQANLTGRLPLLLENNSGVASHLMTMERYDLGLDYLRNYHDLVYSLTVEDLQKAMQTYWKPDAFCLAVAGPKLEEPIL